MPSQRKAKQSRPAPAAPPLTRRQARHAGFVTKWRKWDWTKQNVELAQETGLTHERIRQIRQILGEAPSPRHHRYRATSRTLEWIRKNADKLRGLTPEQVRRKYRLKVYYHGPLHRFLKEQNLLRDARLKHPWEHMNFDLPNRELQRIWKLSYNLVASHRWIHKRPRGKWNVRGSARYLSRILRSRGQLAAYERAVKAEELNARRYRRRTA